MAHQSNFLPKILVVDDFFGRTVEPLNRDRDHLCTRLGLVDVSDDAPREGGVDAENATAAAQFIRGQTPVSAAPGDTVENDLPGVLKVIESSWRSPVDRLALVLLDLCFLTGLVTAESNALSPGMPEGRLTDDSSDSYFGLTLLAEIRKRWPELPVLIFSAMDRSDVSREFGRMGADAFIEKDSGSAGADLRAAVSRYGLFGDSLGQIVGNSMPILKILRQARQCALHSEPVLIQGERGTGKDLLARFINSSSPKADRPFVVVNSPALSHGLFTAELFGIEKDTATGVSARPGLVEVANGGDLFFDEVADMPAEVQSGVLRVLQDKQIVRVGGREPVEVDVRFLAATNRYTTDGIEGLRTDLYDRLRHGGLIHLPPLKDRKEDIKTLALRYLQDRGFRDRCQLTEETLAVMQDYDWPGNVRELHGLLHTTVTRYPDVDFIEPHHLAIAQQPPTPTENGGTQLEEKERETSHVGVPKSIDRLIAQLDAFQIDSDDKAAWAGQLETLELATHRLMARYLETCLSCTTKLDPTTMEERVQIHPAIKLMTGNAAISASKAADIVKRLLKPLADELDGPLAIAYNTAVRLRPGSHRQVARPNTTNIS